MENTREYTKEEKKTQKIFRAWSEINLNALEHNIAEIKKILPEGCKIMAVVKANAYGHGDLVISNYLNQIGIFSFAVATMEEGIRLRKSGVKGKILILGYTPAPHAKEIARYDLTQTIVDFTHAKELAKTGISLKVQIKIDTGMHRLGISPDQKEDIVSLFFQPSFSICGMYTHLCAADSLLPEDVAFSKKQIASFQRLTKELENEGISLPSLHIQSSYGILNYPGLSCDFARIGILLYGCHSQIDTTLLQPDVIPVLSLYSRIAMIREVEEGESVGYGRTYYADKKRKLAIVPIGYADGYPRSLSNRGYVLIHGKKANIVGRICMDQMIVDISSIESVRPGDRVTLIGRDGSSIIRAEELATLCGTITNEFLSRLGSRISRVFFHDGF